MKIKNYNIEIDGKNFCDQSINDSIKQYDKIRKILTGQSDDYTAGCLLDYVYFKEDFRKITADLSKKKALDTEPQAIQQIIFTGQVDDEALTVFYILEQSKVKRNNARIFQRNNKSVVTTYKWLNTVK